MNPRALFPTLLTLASILAWAVRPALAQTPPPDEDWQQFRTDHFVITYPGRLDELARRAASRAERAYVLLAQRFVATPDGPVQLLLTDHADISNGFATPIPYNQITIFARPPMDGGSLSYFDDWLELVITHELVHTFHLDMAGGLGKVLRTVFGRLPMSWPAFPSASAPTWLTEGMATYFESELTGAGRVKGTWQEMVMRAAALDGAFTPVDQVSGHSPVWPAGNRPYVYGSRYLEHMAHLHGEGSIGDFARSLAGLYVPFRINAAARGAFGETVADSWAGWHRETVARYRSLADSLSRQAPLTTGETVEEAGRLAHQAVVSGDGETLAFLRASGVDDPQIRLSNPDGSNPRSLTRINSTGGTLSWEPTGGLVFAQLDFTDPYRLTSDLYRANPDGSVERLTRGQRLTYADVSPDGTRAVAVQEGGGTNVLVLMDLATGDVTPLSDPDPDQHWALPRWSPDGRRIAAVRWIPPAMMDIVVLGDDGTVITEVTRDRAVDTTPFWTQDGSTVIWSSDRTGIPNIFAATLRAERAPEVRQVTHMLGGASHPSTDPLGRWIYFSSYHSNGWHIERIPFAPATWFTPLPMSARFATAAPREETALGTEPPRAYSALPTLRPYYWTPAARGPTRGTDQAGVRRDIIRPTVGLQTGGSDLVGRHVYSASARVSINGQRFAGGLTYGYRGFGNPALGFSLAQGYDASSRTLGVQFPDGSLREFFLVERERSARLSASFQRPRLKSFASLVLSGGFIREDLTLQDPEGNEGPTLRSPPPQRNLGEVRATLSGSTTSRRAFSFSREDGVSAFVSGRIRREMNLDPARRNALGQDRGFQDVVGEAAAFKAIGGPGFANHVLALRFSAGAGFGPGANQFHFDVGGAEGTRERVTGLGLFGGSSLLFPIRGYPENVRSGRIAWTASAEYRVPLALIDRGAGSFPVFFDRIHGTIFFDAGNAWGPDLNESGYDNPRRKTLASIGGELSAIVSPFYLRGIVLRFGAGVPLQAHPPDLGKPDPVFYLRVGNPF